MTEAVTMYCGSKGTVVPFDGTAMDRAQAEMVRRENMTWSLMTARWLPKAPGSAPQSLVARWTKIRDGLAITLSWSPIPGATAYLQLKPR